MADSPSPEELHALIQRAASHGIDRSTFLMMLESLPPSGPGDAPEEEARAMAEGLLAFGTKFALMKPGTDPDGDAYRLTAKGQVFFELFDLYSDGVDVFSAVN